MSYQKTTGTLSQGANPGSYNGQDAYNNMLVTDYDFYNSKTGLSHEGAVGYGIRSNGNGLQRSAYDFEGGGKKKWLQQFGVYCRLSANGSRVFQIIGL